MVCSTPTRSSVKDALPSGPGVPDECAQQVQGDGHLPHLGPAAVLQDEARCSAASHTRQHARGVADAEKNARIPASTQHHSFGFVFFGCQSVVAKRHCVSAQDTTSENGPSFAALVYSSVCPNTPEFSARRYTYMLRRDAVRERTRHPYAHLGAMSAWLEYRPLWLAASHAWAPTMQATAPATLPTPDSWLRKNAGPKKPMVCMTCGGDSQVVRCKGVRGCAAGTIVARDGGWTEMWM
jgi:hypothetical protein